MDGPVYVDSSALVKIYVPEADSDDIEELLRRRRDLVISDLVVTEIVSAAARRMREGTLPREKVAYLQQSILEDVESDRVRLVDLRSTTHRDAERILMTFDSVSLRAS
ncbi:MAG: type II toxin-antitoxin system VapC family toxin, partial [Acidobacteria bacterium]|nr:type II toxin-antitoxin system VapC family toxin [Acidobacteriota bacterium]